MCAAAAIFATQSAAFIFPRGSTPPMRTRQSMFGRRRPGGTPQPSRDPDLYNIDTKIQKLANEVQRLKNQKRIILGNTPGLKLVNSTKLYIPIFDHEDDDDEEDDDYDEDEEDDYEPDDDELAAIAAMLSAASAQQQQSQTRSALPQRPTSSQFRPGIRIFQRQAPQRRGEAASAAPRSENFAVVRQNMNFSNIGGYDTIKRELMQCSDLLLNADKYARFNVRTPKGLILEGPPGNGKTLLAKCFSGEINVSFIPVSGAQFQEKYVGVGASRIRELFKLASENVPCIVFIDEIDALGRKRSDDDSSHNAERDTTLNELLVALDGFQTAPGVFLLASTNRVDLLDPALTRPGRIDKSVYVGTPDAKTRRAIIDIHIQGKPYDPATVDVEALVEMTQGCSGAQIENLCNEAMLLALRDGREMMTYRDLEFIMTRIMVGWQSTENAYSNETLYRIAVHEMGHAIVGTLVPGYRKLKKVCLNLWSPKNPGFTLFEGEGDDMRMHTKESLFAHLCVLLSGRIAEEVFFHSVSTGASHDLEQARKLAEEMVTTYGMGTKAVHPTASNKYREVIDGEIDTLIDTAYKRATYLVMNSRAKIEECSRALMENHTLSAEQVYNQGIVLSTDASPQDPEPPRLRLW